MAKSNMFCVKILFRKHFSTLLNRKLQLYEKDHLHFTRRWYYRTDLNFLRQTNARLRWPYADQMPLPLLGPAVTNRRWQLLSATRFNDQGIINSYPGNALDTMDFGHAEYENVCININ